LLAYIALKLIKELSNVRLWHKADIGQRSLTDPDV